MVDKNNIELNIGDYVWSYFKYDDGSIEDCIGKIIGKKYNFNNDIIQTQVQIQVSKEIDIFRKCCQIKKYQSLKLFYIFFLIDTY